MQPIVYTHKKFIVVIQFLFHLKVKTHRYHQRIRIRN